MVEKKKVGKGRLDKYYYLAKEQGYRARSAFKLVQLNNKYHFLENARVLVDLCAAPGGWLQVASKYMPLSRHIIGVDLDAIKPIPGVKTFVSDITTEKCRSELKKELATWKADVFLNDGAPNVGSAWCKDAYNQAELVLMALKLACEFLIENGTFVTKIFRSKDYNSLLWVFGQLFKKVESTKPASSRDVSAEIFVVCSGYLAPKKIDPRLFDPKSVFEEVEENEQPASVNIFKPEKRSRQRNGYEDGVTVIFKKSSLADFIRSTDPMQFLSIYNQITVDDGESNEFAKLASKEVAAMKGYFEDLKVLGKSEFRQILRWRVKIRKAAGLDQPKTEPTSTAPIGDDEEEYDSSEKEIEQLDERVDSLKRQEKKSKKKQLERKSKERIRMQLGMTHRGDVQDGGNQVNLFDLKSAPLEIPDLPYEEENEMETTEQQESDNCNSDQQESFLEDFEEQMEEEYKNKKTIKPQFVMPSNEDSADEQNDSQASDCDHNSQDNPLIVKDPFADRNSISSWFDRPEFNDSSDSDSDTNNSTFNFPKHPKKPNPTPSLKIKSAIDSNPLTTPTAIQHALTIRDHGKEELIDNSFNRYAFGDDETNLPDWFLDDEKRHSQAQTPPTKEAIMLLKERMKSITARPIKKVQEFMFRQRARNQRKLDALKKKASTIVDSEEMNDKQKLTTITKLMGKGGSSSGKKKPSLVIARGGNKGIKGRPKGVKGHYKMVDSRMKKELRAKQRRTQKNKK